MRFAGGARSNRHAYSPEQAAELERLIEETKARHSLSDLIGRHTDLRRAGPREVVGLCVFHREKTPSMRVNDDLGTFYCFGCGASGDHIRFIQMKEGVGFMAALRYLGAADLPVVDPAERVRRREVQDAERRQATIDARQFFADAGEVAATAGETYLRARGITELPEPHGTIRFDRVPAWQDVNTQKWGSRRPALICGCQDVAGTFTGIQRIFVDGREPDKAAVKLTLGRVRGSALRLGPAQSEIVITEGPEDALSLRQALPGRSIWCSCGTGLMPAVEFPDAVTSIIIAGQNNDPGRAAVEAASEAYLDRGLAVRAIYPADDFDDWNDELRGRCR